MEVTASKTQTSIAFNSLQTPLSQEYPSLHFQNTIISTLQTHLEHLYTVDSHRLRPRRSSGATYRKAPARLKYWPEESAANLWTRMVPVPKLVGITYTSNTLTPIYCHFIYCNSATRIFIYDFNRERVSRRLNGVRSSILLLLRDFCQGSPAPPTNLCLQWPFYGSSIKFSSTVSLAVLDEPPGTHSLKSYPTDHICLLLFFT